MRRNPEWFSSRGPQPSSYQAPVFDSDSCACQAFFPMCAAGPPTTCAVSGNPANGIPFFCLLCYRICSSGAEGKLCNYSPFRYRKCTRGIRSNQPPRIVDCWIQTHLQYPLQKTACGPGIFCLKSTVRVSTDLLFVMFSSTLLSLLASSTLLVQGLPVIDNTATTYRRDSETSTPSISRRGSEVETTPPISRRGSQVETTPFKTDSEVSLESRNTCDGDDDPIRGVNLGGWLVLEPWMNWELVGNTGAPDQWTFDQTDNAEAALQSHWGSWFGEADMAKIASWGLNTYVLLLSPNTVSVISLRDTVIPQPFQASISTLFSLALDVVSNSL